MISQLIQCHMIIESNIRTPVFILNLTNSLRKSNKMLGKTHI